jgi:hypothetical protein
MKKQKPITPASFAEEQAISEIRATARLWLITLFVTKVAYHELKHDEPGFTPILYR